MFLNIILNYKLTSIRLFIMFLKGGIIISLRKIITTKLGNNFPTEFRGFLNIVLDFFYTATLDVMVLIFPTSVYVLLEIHKSKYW